MHRLRNPRLVRAISTLLLLGVVALLVPTRSEARAAARWLTAEASAAPSLALQAAVAQALASTPRTADEFFAAYGPAQRAAGVESGVWFGYAHLSLAETLARIAQRYDALDAPETRAPHRVLTATGPAATSTPTDPGRAVLPGEVRGRAPRTVAAPVVPERVPVATAGATASHRTRAP